MRVRVGADDQTSKSFDVRGEQVSLIFRQLPLVFFTNIINPLLIAGVLAAVVPVLEVAVWSGLMVILTGIRFLHFRERENEQHHIDNPERLVSRLTVASGVSGCLWGIGLVLLLPESLLYRLFVAFVLGHGGGIGRHLVAAASGGDSLPAALHAAADDPPRSGRKPRLAGHVRPCPAVHLLHVGRGLEAEPLEFHHASFEDGKEPACR